MGTYDDFDVALAERDAQLYRFKLGGREYTVPPGDIRQLAGFRDMGERLAGQGMAEAIDTLVDFLCSQLKAEDRESFRATILATLPPLDMLTRLAERMAEGITGRPLSQPVPSHGNVAPTSETSRDGVSPTVLPPPTSDSSPSATG